MRKFLSLILALALLLTVVGTAFAEEEAAASDGSVGEQGEEAAASDGSAGEEGEEATTEEASDGSAGEEGEEPAAEEATSEEGEESEGSGGGWGAASSEPVPEIPLVVYATVEADEATGQQMLTYLEDVTPILEIDGLKFKDHNKNGELDAYEDYRNDIATRTADLISQLTVEEKAGLMLHSNASDDIVSENALPDSVLNYGQLHFLDNTNGTPDEMTNRHNYMQLLAENTRLGIPMTISSDRQYNAWGGYIDTPHNAFGVANDTELAAQVWEAHAKETRAVGYHLLLGPYGVELNTFNGEDPAYVAKMITTEVQAVKTSMYTCVKHFIASGGMASIPFAGKRSIAQVYENQMVSWKAAIEAGTQWIMTNGYNSGLSNTVNVDYDPETMSYLRDTLGYDGVVLTDWGAMGRGETNIWEERGMSDGITSDGTDLNHFTIPERYAWVVNNGVDQLGGVGASGRQDLVDAINGGLISQERLDQAITRIVYIKFDLGLFENPYCDMDAAMALCASPEYIAERWELTDNESLATARNPETVELERKLQAKAAVLIKNDDDILPLKAGDKVYFAANNTTTAELYAKAAEGRIEVAPSIADADIVVLDITRMDDAAELIIEDTQDAGKKLVITANSTTPNVDMITYADALIFLSFSRAADHGTAMAGFLTTTEPVVYVDLLTGAREPEGMIVNEVPRSEADNIEQWKDLATDIGVVPQVRLILLALTRENPAATLPSNYGDALLGYEYGMRYGQAPEFEYDTLYLPTVIGIGNTQTMFGLSEAELSVTANAKAGEPYTVNFLLWNNGGDGLTTVQAYDGDTLIAEKIEAVNGGSWRIVTMDLVFDAPGEHQLTIGDLSAVITVE